MGSVYNPPQVGSGGGLSREEIEQLIAQGSTEGFAVNAASYGVSASNTDNAAKLIEALAAAKGGTLVLPPGVLKLKSAVGNVECNLVGQGTEATQIKCLEKLTPGTPYLKLKQKLSQSNNVFMASGFTLRGPGAYSLGNKTADCAGMEILNPAKLWNLRITNFDEGLRENSTGGHIRHLEVECTNNYYGVYQILQNSDYSFIDCIINGNTFAGLATPSDQGWDSLNCAGGHYGYQPFAFYQEAGPAEQGGEIFIQDAHFMHTRFENLGNGIFNSQADYLGGNASKFRDIRMWGPGHSIHNSYRLESQPHDYAIDVGNAEGLIFIDSGSSLIQNYTKGRIRIRSGTCDLVYVKSAGTAPTAADLSSDSGAGVSFNYGKRQLTSFDLYTRTIKVTTSTSLGAGNKIVLVDATANDVTITLPKPSSQYLEEKSYRVTVRRIDGSAKTVTIKGAEGNVNATASIAITSGQSATAVSDGENYWTL